MKYLLIIFMLIGFAAPSGAARLYWEFNPVPENVGHDAIFSGWYSVGDHTQKIKMFETEDLSHDLPGDLVYPTWLYVTARWKFGNGIESPYSTHALYLPQAPSDLTGVRLSQTPTDTEAPEKPTGLSGIWIDEEEDGP